MLGRVDEFSALTAVAMRAARGGSALVVEGEAGIGKTTLLTAVATWACDNGFTVLSCAGVQCQTKVGYAALHELIHPILGHAEALPAHQKSALFAAIGLAEPESPDPLHIGVAALGLIEEAAAHRPLLLLVDDAQWLDGSSLNVLTFIGRRVATTPVVLLCAARPHLDGEPARLLSLSRFPLGPTDDATSHALFDEAVSELGDENPLSSWHAIECSPKPGAILWRSPSWSRPSPPAAVTISTRVRYPRPGGSSGCSWTSSTPFPSRAVTCWR